VADLHGESGRTVVPACQNGACDGNGGVEFGFFVG